MPTVRRKEFDSWWNDPAWDDLRNLISNGKDNREELCWRAWQAAANRYGDPDVNKLVADREALVAKGYSSKVAHLEKEVAKWCLETSIRKEVHRDDFLRSTIMMSALKRILELVPEDSQIYNIANQAIVETWGIAPTKHCERHAGYKSTCPDCMMVGRSKARGHDLIYSEKEKA